MICDAAKPMCIAGVFGGLNSGVTEQTTDIFLESAYFNPTRIRRSARRHGLSTDASFRYERGLDPNATLYALKLAALMVKELAGGEICGEPVDIYPEPVAPFKVDFSLDYLRRLVGKEIPEETVNSILRSLEIETTGRDGDTLHLLVPTYRVDVQRPCDVVEDILRIYGYNNVEINDTVHSALQLTTIANESDDLTRLISDQLTGAGFHEILNNSLTAEAYYADLKAYPADHCVKLLNPLSNDLNVMRQTLLFGGLESIAHNVNRRADSLAFYEFGNVYSMRPDVESTAEAPLAPYSEGARLALWLTGNASRGNWSVAAREATFFDLKGHVATSSPASASPSAKSQSPKARVATSSPLILQSPHARASSSARWVLYPKPYSPRPTCVSPWSTRSSTGMHLCAWRSRKRWNSPRCPRRSP